MKGYGVTDKGKIRRENQDSYVLQLLRKPEGALVVVCDGMGGARAGGIASSMASLSKIRSVPTLTVVSSSLPSTSPVLSVNFVAALPSE